MSIDINLISKRTFEDSRENRVTKLKNYSFVLLFFVGFLSLVVFLINYRFSVNYVKRQQENLIKKLSIYDNTAAKIVFLNSRLGDISTITAQRNKFNKTSSSIFEGNLTSINLKDYAIDESGISMELSSPSLNILNDFLNYLLKLTKTKELSSVSLESLSTQNSEYIMKVSAI